MASELNEKVEDLEGISDSDMEEFEDALEEINAPPSGKKKEINKQYIEDYMSSDEDMPDMEKIVEQNSNINDNDEIMHKLKISEDLKVNSEVECTDEHTESLTTSGNDVIASNGATVEEEADESDSEDAEEPKEDLDVRKEREEKMTDEERETLKSKAQELKTKGNELFKEKKFEDALEQYTDGLHICPLCYAKERSMMYSNRAACKMHLERFESAIEDSSKAVELNPRYLKALLRRAELQEKVDKLDEALADYQRVLEMDPSQHSARQACMRLPDQIKERNEKLKEEMMGKLKDLGNMVLKPFGLSTDNFKLQQDPNSGSYSVNFQQNKDS